MAVIVFPGFTVSELPSEAVALKVLEAGAYRFTFTRHMPGFEGVPVFSIVP